MAYGMRNRRTFRSNSSLRRSGSIGLSRHRRRCRTRCIYPDSRNSCCTCPPNPSIQDSRTCCCPCRALTHRQQFSLTPRRRNEKAHRKRKRRFPQSRSATRSLARIAPVHLHRCHQDCSTLPDQCSRRSTSMLNLCSVRSHRHQKGLEGE